MSYQPLNIVKIFGACEMNRYIYRLYTVINIYNRNFKFPKMLINYRCMQSPFFWQPLQYLCPTSSDKHIILYMILGYHGRIDIIMHSAPLTFCITIYNLSQFRTLRDDPMHGEFSAHLPGLKLFHDHMHST